jgi:putative restriction endonuclease
MVSKNQPEKYGTLWTREELILAFDLYCRIPFKKTKANNPEVVELAKLLRRSPASVARKLGNFGSFDPALRQQQVTGLVHTSKLDGEIWEEFNSDWNRLVLEARRLRDMPDSTKQLAEAVEDEIQFPQGASEREAVRKTRVHQAFFREAVLSSYEDTCCVTGLKIKECLVASHIIPWSVSEQYRTDPRNGLCLSATFDRLFDYGLITLTTDLEVVVSAHLLKSGDKRTREIVCRFHGAPMIKPRRFLPLQSHLEWHRRNIFFD